MAEVLAAFAALSSFLQILDFTAKLAKHAYTTAADRKVRKMEDNDAEKLAEEFEEVLKISTKMSTLDPANSSETGNHQPEECILRLRKQCQVEIDKLKDLLEPLRTSPSSDGTGRSKKRLKQMFDKTIFEAFKAERLRKAIDEQRRRLEELNGLFATATLEESHIKHGSDISAVFEEARSIKVEVAKEFTAENARRAAAEQQTQVLRKTAHLLEDLAFEGIAARSNAIPESYRETYEWAVNNESAGLREWLRAGSDIFWVCGKAGSGKSTFMKFLASSAVTTKLLQTWSGQQELVTGSFYFWYPGSLHQKSIAGLMRTILHHVLQADTSLMAAAFPQHYIDLRGLKPLSDGEVQRAFQSMLKGEWQSRLRKKFCLFIDGLDEFHGNPLVILQLLKCVSLHEDVKLCVSSRPWNPFKDCFQAITPSLRLEDLTYNDIKTYVEGKLEDHAPRGCTSSIDDVCIRSHPGSNEDSSLADYICARADGVFLWVYLAVESVLRGIAEGDPTHMMWQRVREFPQDLEDFFKQIFTRVESVYRKQTCQALKLALMSAQRDRGERLERDPDASWLNYWLISQNARGLEDRRFIRSLPKQEPSCYWLEMQRETFRFLSAACKDLLHIPEKNTGSPEAEVEFLHRSVYDFLISEDMQAELDKNLPAHFFDRHIGPLLRAARLRFYRCYTLKDLVRISREACLSFGTITDADVENDCIEMLESTLLRFRDPERHEASFLDDLDSTLVSNEGSLMLVHLIARHRHKLVLEVLNTFVAEGRNCLSEDDLVDSNPSALLRAALGESGIRSFPLSEVDLHLVKTLLQFEDTIDDFDASDCERSVWVLLFQKWLRSMPHNTVELRHAWELTKLFLAAGVSPHETFCTEPQPDSKRRSEHIGMSVKNFLQRSLPASWLLEADDPCLYALCSHESLPFICHMNVYRDNYQDRQQGDDQVAEAQVTLTSIDTQPQDAYSLMTSLVLS